VTAPSPTSTGVAARLRFADPTDAADLAVYLARLMKYERKAAIRLRADGPVLGVFGRPPFGVLALRTVPLAESLRLDLTVPAVELLERFRPGAEDPGRVVDLPEPVAGPAWAGVLPPRGGWQQVSAAPACALVSAVRHGVADFRARTTGLSEAERTRTRLDRIADEVWSRPVLAGLPLRAAHAAQALGFLTADGDAAVYRTAGWLRLDAQNGSIAVRLARPLSLQVV
jgi:hypothetical protein